MTSVQNHLLPLSGNRKNILLFCLILCLSAWNVQAKDKVFQIALLLPFNASQVDLDKVVLEQNDFNKSNLAIDFYRASKIALDSLAKQGYDISVRVFDTKSDSNEIKLLSMDPELMRCDYIFAAISPTEIQMMLKKNPLLRGKIISAISPAVDKNWKSRDVIVASSTLEDHAKAMARYVLKLKPINYTLLRSGLLAETRYSKSFLMQSDSIDKKILHKEVLTANVGFAPLLSQLSKSRENCIVVASGDQAYAIKLFKFLEDLNDEYKISLFVHPVWVDYQTIDPKLFIKYNVHTTSSYFVDYTNANTNQFVLNYRANYFTEPSEIAFRAFDQMFFFIKEYNNSVLKSTYQGEGMSSVYSYSTKSEYGRNKAVFILKYTEEGLIKVQ